MEEGTISQFYERNKIRIHQLPVKDEALMYITGFFIVIGFLLIPSGGNTGESTAYGTYNPAEDEINIYVNESDEMYEPTVYHEQKHREFFQAMPDATYGLYLSSITMGLLVSLFAFLTLRADYWKWAIAMLILPKAVVEYHAITLTFLKFQGWHSLLYALWFPMIAYIMNDLGRVMKRLEHYIESDAYLPLYSLTAWRNALRDYYEFIIWVGKKSLIPVKYLIRRLKK